MTDREAMLALAAPEPDYFDTPGQWQVWHDRYVAALRHARTVAREGVELEPIPRYVELGEAHP